MNFVVVDGDMMVSVALGKRGDGANEYTQEGKQITHGSGCE